MISLEFPHPRLRRLCEHALARCDYPFARVVRVSLNNQISEGAISHVGWVEINDKADNFALLDRGARALIHEMGHQVDMLELTVEQRDVIRSQILETEADWESFDKSWDERPVEAFCDLFVLAYTDINPGRSSKFLLTRAKAQKLRDLLTPGFPVYPQQDGPKYSMRQSYDRDGSRVSETVISTTTLTRLADALICDLEVRRKLRPKRGQKITVIAQ